MTVRQLIDALSTMPQDAEVLHLWDGEARTEINVVYISKAGSVITADYDMVCYSTHNRPIFAPSYNEDKFWKTPKE